MKATKERQTGRPPDLLQQVLEMEQEWRRGQLELSPEELGALRILQGSDIGRPVVATSVELTI